MGVSWTNLSYFKHINSNCIFKFQIAPSKGISLFTFIARKKESIEF